MDSSDVSVARVTHGPKDYQLAAQSSRDPVLLARLAELDYPFVKLAVAENAATAPATLAALIPAGQATWNDRALLLRVVKNPSADADVLAAAAERVAGALARGERPYSVAITLAEDTRVAATTVEDFASLSGSSSRLRRGLRAAIAARLAEADSAPIRRC